MKYWSLLALALAFPAAVFGQIKFKEISHDFGPFKEGEVVTHKFVFTNESKAPVTLQSVKASCGCTTPHYSRTAVAPGDTGSVSAVYNSMGRPGRFTKTVTVNYDSTQGPIILTISGDVISKEGQPNGAQPQAAPVITPKPAVAPAKPAPSGGHNHSGHDHPHASSVLLNDQGESASLTAIPLIKKQSLSRPQEVAPAVLPLPLDPTGTYYGDTLGALAFDRTYADFGTVSSEETKDVEIRVRNVSDKSINILKPENIRPWLLILPADITLSPGQESVVKIRFVGPEAKKQNVSASIDERLVLNTSEPSPMNQKYLSISGTFKRTLTPEELANAPKIQFDGETFDAGEILAGESLKHAFVFHNKGKSDLVIESAKASCGCTASAPKEKIIKPGESSSIEATFNSQGREGAQHKTITVVSNDPNTPKVTLHLKCNVKPDPFSIGQKGLPLNSGGQQPMGGGGF